MSVKHTPTKLPRIVDVSVNGSMLHVAFDDGTAGTIPLAPLCEIPAFAALKNDSYVASVRLERGVVCWPGGEDLDPWWVHENAMGYYVTREDEQNTYGQGEPMPAISLFYGVVISMFYRESQQHHAPHFHASYAEHEAVFGIADGSLIAGSLPNNKRLLVEAWLEIHREDLMSNWMLCRNGQAPLPITPLQ